VINSSSKSSSSGSSSSTLLSSLARYEKIEDTQMTLLIRRHYEYLILKHDRALELHNSSLTLLVLFNRRIAESRLADRDQMEQLNVLSRMVSECAQIRQRFVQHAFQMMNNFYRDYSDALGGGKQVEVEEVVE
jgi:hypothetical protein